MAIGLRAGTDQAVDLLRVERMRFLSTVWLMTGGTQGGIKEVSSRVVTAYGLAPADCDERRIGDALVGENLYDVYLADKGFSSVVWEKRWREEHDALVAVTPQRTVLGRKRRAARAAGKRQIIEGVIWQLKDLFGLLTRLAAKIAAYACGQLFNTMLGRPLPNLASRSKNCTSPILGRRLRRKGLGLTTFIVSTRRRRRDERTALTTIDVGLGTRQRG
jgi:hypothetical protein